MIRTITRYFDTIDTLFSHDNTINLLFLNL